MAQTEPPTDPELAPPDATPDDLDEGTTYVGSVTGTEPYGVFVALTPRNGTDLTGLAHESDLPPLTEPREFDLGERVAVEFLGTREDGDVEFAIAYGESSGSAAGPIPDTHPTSRKRAIDAGKDADDTGRLATADQVGDLGARLDAIAAAISRVHGEVTASTEYPFAVQAAIDQIVALHENGHTVTSIEHRLDDGPAIVVAFDDQPSDDPDQ